MLNDSVSNKRIAKNTLFLYFRTILIMIVTLFTSRVVLNSLGIEDYGIYNAVGGVVLMFYILTGAMSNAISRYITYGIGKNDTNRLQTIFSTSINIQIFISIIVFVVCEVFGLLFLNNKMNIPTERLAAANWVLHCSLLTFVINLISVPYNACIIAHEHMNAYAYISVFDAALKLSIAYLLIVSPIDKLIAYSILLVLASLIIRILYGIYCKKNFEECRYRVVYDKRLFKELMGFAGWNFLTNGTSVVNNQGVNLLINVFFGVVANSARGIASQIDAAITQFASSFITAVNPQITISYAQNNMDRLYYLVCKGAKFCFLLLLFFVVPIFFEAEKILELWLVNVPEGACLFVKLDLIGIMITVIGNTGFTACMATGNIKKYSIWITVIGSLVFFLTWLSYKMGSPVYTTYIIYILVYAVVQIVRLLLMKELLAFPIKLFIKNVLCPISLTGIVVLIVPWLITKQIEPSVSRVAITVFASTLWTSICIYLFAFTQGERKMVKSKFMSIIKKIK